MSRVTRRFFWKIWNDLAPGVKLILQVMVWFCIPWYAIAYILNRFFMEDPVGIVFFSLIIWLFCFGAYHTSKELWKYTKKIWEEAKDEVRRENRAIMRAFED